MFNICWTSRAVVHLNAYLTGEEPCVWWGDDSWASCFPSVCCCYVIAGVLFPASVSRLAASPDKQRESWGRPDETGPCFLQLSSTGVEWASCRSDREVNPGVLNCCLRLTVISFFEIPRNPQDDSNNLFGNAASWRWVVRYLGTFLFFFLGLLFLWIKTFLRSLMINAMCVIALKLHRLWSKLQLRRRWIFHGAFKLSC